MTPCWIRTVAILAISACLVSCASSGSARKIKNETARSFVVSSSTPLQVRPIMQESALSCWATAGEMIMTYWNEHQNWQGPVRRQCEQMMHEYPYVNCCDITSATPMPIDCGLGGWPQFPDWGLSCSVNSGHPLSWDDLRSEIDAARPFTYSGPYPVNHMVVVVAYDTTRTRQRITVLMPDGGQPTDTVTILYSDYAARHKPYQQDYYNIHPAPSTP